MNHCTCCHVNAPDTSGFDPTICAPCWNMGVRGTSKDGRMVVDPGPAWSGARETVRAEDYILAAMNHNRSDHHRRSAGANPKWLRGLCLASGPRVLNLSTMSWETP